MHNHLWIVGEENARNFIFRGKDWVLAFFTMNSTFFMLFRVELTSCSVPLLGNLRPEKSGVFAKKACLENQYYKAELTCFLFSPPSNSPVTEKHTQGNEWLKKFPEEGTQVQALVLIFSISEVPAPWGHEFVKDIVFFFLPTQGTDSLKNWEFFFQHHDPPVMILVGVCRNETPSVRNSTYTSIRVDTRLITLGDWSWTRGRLGSWSWNGIRASNHK